MEPLNPPSPPQARRRWRTGVLVATFLAANVASVLLTSADAAASGVGAMVSFFCDIPG